MNILAITQIYPQPDDEGEDRPTATVEYFAKQWVDMGHDVTVIHCPSKFPIVCYMIPSFLSEYISNKRGTTPFPVAARKRLVREEHGIKVYRLPMFKPYPGKAFSKSTMDKQTKLIIEEINKDDFTPDLVVGHFANPSLELVVNLAEHYVVPSSFVFHRDCTINNIKKYRMDELINRVGAVGARSLVEANQIKKDLNLSEKPFVCYSGVPNESVANCVRECKKHNYESGMNHIYVGSMLSRKHVDSVVRAFDVRYHGKNATFSIIGGGQEEQNLRSLVQERDLSNQVSFLGTMSREDVMKYMRESHIFTMISSSETFGMVYIEAMLQGCIVIASRDEGFDGIIVDGVNGFLCEAGNEKELANIYEQIDKMSIDERNRIGQEAINTALQFSERAVAERYLNDVIERNGRNINNAGC